MLRLNNVDRARYKKRKDFHNHHPKQLMNIQLNCGIVALPL